MSDALVFGRDLAAWRTESRAALGLPTDRFVVMTGHQAGIWHAGIAEKFVVGARLAAERGGVGRTVGVAEGEDDDRGAAPPAAACACACALKPKVETQATTVATCFTNWCN